MLSDPRPCADCCARGLGRENDAPCGWAWYMARGVLAAAVWSRLRRARGDGVSWLPWLLDAMLVSCCRASCASNWAKRRAAAPAGPNRKGGPRPPVPKAAPPKRRAGRNGKWLSVSGEKLIGGKVETGLLILGSLDYILGKVFLL